MFRIENGESFSFPNSAEILIVLGPSQPFGVEAGGGRTAVRAVAATANFNANTGEHTIDSHTPLSPLDLTIHEPNRRLELRGNQLRVIVERVESNRELTELIESIYYGLPILLNVEFADPPVIERIRGNVGESLFRWELADWRFEFHTTTQEEQERKVARSWERFGLLSSPGNRRLIGALHYFYKASRLRNAGHSPWEFTAEIILNLSKSLEILFPPSGDGQPRDAVRNGLTALGYSSGAIERNFIPAMALRNEIDVGHVDLSLYTRTQLQTLHRYTEMAEDVLREMLERTMTRMANGETTLEPHDARSVGARARRIIERLESNFREFE